MQKRLDFAVLVKGLFLTGKKFFSIGPSHRTKTESLSAPPVKQGRRSNFFSFSRPHRAIWGSAPAGTCLPPAP